MKALFDTSQCKSSERSRLSAVVLRDLAKQKVSFECFLDLKAVEKIDGRLQVTLQHTLTGRG